MKTVLCICWNWASLLEQPASKKMYEMFEQEAVIFAYCITHVNRIAWRQMSFVLVSHFSLTWLTDSSCYCEPCKKKSYFFSSQNPDKTVVYFFRWLETVDSSSSMSFPLLLSVSLYQYHSLSIFPVAPQHCNHLVCWPHGVNQKKQG